MIIDAVDTYYEYVKNRIQNGVANPDGSWAVYNPTRVFMGYAEAQTWPPANIQAGGLYLIVTNQFSEPKWGTKSNPMYRSVCQWTWIIEGTDIQPNTTGNNRGDRFRMDQALREELLRANFPRFCPLLSVSLDQTSGVLVKTPYNPTQVCRWTDLQFGPRPSAADDSGVLYGAAAVDVLAFQQPLVA